MNYERLLDKKEKLLKMQTSNSVNIFENFNKAFEIEYAHNSTAIEGNTLTLLLKKQQLKSVVLHLPSFTVIMKMK